MTHSDSRKPKILIVDDKPENLIVLEQLLGQLDVDLIKAFSGNEALAHTLEHDFVLILLDVQMPGMDGYEVLEILSWDERTKHIPVIFITANYADEQHKLKGYLTGAVDYLSKPINDQILLSKVKVFLELDQQKQQLLQLQARYQSILESAGEGIMGLDAEGTITFANPASMQLLGWSCNDITGNKIDCIFPKKCSDHHRFHWTETPLYHTCAKGEVHKENDTLFIKSNGQSLPVQYTATPIHNANKRFQGVVLVFTDISLHKKIQQQLREMAHHDHLTHLPNRLLFEKALHKTLTRCDRHQQSAALLYLDLDGFKQINDTYGHATGDAFLQTFAERIQGCIRQSDTVARLGGDEFALLLDQIHNEDDAVVVAKKIFTTLETPFTLQDKQFQAKPSIGIACYPGAGNNAQQLLRHADEAMYIAKNKGGNQSVVYRTDSQPEALDAQDYAAMK